MRFIFRCLQQTAPRSGLKKASFVAFSLLLGVVYVQPTSGQAWTRSRGEVYVRATYGRVTAAEQYTFDGRETDFIDGLEGDTFRDRSFYAYSELGLTDDLTFVLTVPYKRTFIEDQAFRYRTFGLGTASLGLRVALPWLDGASSALAANVGVNLPLGYTRNLTPSVGSGQADAQIQLSYGRSFWPFPGYAQVSAGYRYRSSVYGFSKAVDCQEGQDIDCIQDRKPDFENEFLYSFEAGLTPLGGGLLLQVKANGTTSIREPIIGFTAINPVPTRQRFFKIGVGGAIYPFALAKAERLTTLGLSAEYYVTPQGRNTIDSRDLFVALEYRRQLF